MTTDARGNPLLSLTGAEPHLTKRERMRQKNAQVADELRGMGGGVRLMGGGAPPSRVRNYDEGYEGKRGGPSY